MKHVLHLLTVAALSFAAFDQAAANTFTCRASWYGPGLQGNKMANGKRFDMNDPVTVAHKSLPFGTKLRLTNTKNGRQHVVTVRDRGPYVGSRCLDISRAGAVRLGFVNAGTAVLKAEVLN